MQLKVIFLRIRIKQPYYMVKPLLCGMILESYISDKKLITETEYLEIKTTIKAIFDDIVFAENDIDPILNY
jgi:3-dehydroquinate synthase